MQSIQNIEMVHKKQDNHCDSISIMNSVLNPAKVLINILLKKSLFLIFIVFYAYEIDKLTGMPIINRDGSQIGSTVIFRHK